MNDDDEGREHRRIFMDLVSGRRPVAGGGGNHRGAVDEDTAAVILAEHYHRKWSGVQKYGPGATDAAQTAPLEQTTEPAVVSHRPTKKPKTARDRLLARRDKLAAAIRRLKDGRP